ncbi:hypothetical protein QQP08_003771 [Theobroma cacao]|nr:hypothetical protein QQP08_003771 [Theobroma cacao]
MGRTGLNFAVCTLLLAYLALSMTWCPLTVEARIPQFSAIKVFNYLAFMLPMTENLVRLSLTRRSMKEDPPRGRSPLPARWKAQFSPNIGAPRG